MDSFLLLFGVSLMALGAVCTLTLQYMWSFWTTKPSDVEVRKAKEFKVKVDQTEMVTGKGKRASANLGPWSSDTPASSDSSSGFLYLSQTGHCIHKNPHCSGMQNPKKIQACAKCFD